MPDELKERARDYIEDVELRYERGKFLKWACLSVCAVIGALIGLLAYVSGSLFSQALFSRAGLDGCYNEFMGTGPDNTTMLSQCIPNDCLMIAYDYNNQEPRFYSKEFIKIDPGIYDVSIGFASGASASMPGGFPPQVREDAYGLQEVMIDGGIIANNPSLVGRLIAEMKPQVKNGGKKIRILSLGCGGSPLDPNEEVDPEAYQKLTYITDIFDWM
jgi:hypothetical protein